MIRTAERHDVRYAAHYGLNSDIELGPKGANGRHRTLGLI